MANSIRIKRRAAGGAAGAPTSLANAELAFNEQDSTLYYGVGTGGVGGSATSVLAIGGPGAVVTLSGTQAITGAKTFSGANDLGASTTATTQTAADNSTKVATTAFVKSQSYLTGNQTITASGDATGSGTTAISLTLANSGVTAGTYPKVTVDAKGRVTSGAALVATDVPTLTAAKISDFDTQVRTSRLDQLAVPTAAVAMNTQRLTGLGEPAAAQDAATKNYVDNVSAGLDPKASCRVATTANITLSAPQTIDGVAVVAGDRVLVKNQTVASANGIYVVAAGAWTRSADAEVSSEVTSGMFTFIEEGTVNATTGWVLSTSGAIVLNTTALTFVQFSGAGAVAAGSGLSQTGNTLSISSGYVGQSSITTIGTISSGTVPVARVSGLGDLATQSSSTVSITGGSINNAAIGASTQAAGSFTHLTASGIFTLPSGSSGFLDSNIRFQGNPWAAGAGCLRFSANATTPAPTASDVGKVYWTGSDLAIVNSSGAIKTLVYSDGNITGSSASCTGNAATVTNGVYSNVAYVDPAFINSLAKAKVGLGNVENTALSTWAGSANITTIGTISSGTVPVARVSGLAASATTDATNASNISAGTLADARIAAALTGKTYNALTLTAAATGFTVAGGTASKTLTVSNTLTLAGTDASTLNIGAGGTLGTAAFTASTAYATAAQGTKADNVGAVSGIVKSNGAASFSSAVAGTDFLSPSSDIDGGTF